MLSIFKGGHVGRNLKKNLLETDADIMHQVEGLGKYCTFREPNAGKCGYRLGRITRDILAGHEADIMV